MRCAERDGPVHVKAREDLFQRESLVLLGKRDSLACQRDLKEARTGTQDKVGTVTKRDNLAESREHLPAGRELDLWMTMACLVKSLSMETRTTE